MENILENWKIDFDKNMDIALTRLGGYLYWMDEGHSEQAIVDLKNLIHVFPG